MPRKIKCTRCKATFQQQDFYIKHITSCEVKYQNKIKQQPTISCEKCTKKFVYKKSYLIHLRNEHSELKSSIPCDLCLVRCPNKKILEDHIKTVHVKNKYFCPKCNVAFARKGHVSRHLKQSKCGGAKNKKFKCDICNATFSRKDNLMSHLRYQHINSKCYYCKLCQNGLSFKSLTRLITHTQKVHWKNVQYECDICGKSTGSKNTMVKHMEIHGEKKYGCEVCGYTTFTPEVMRRHILTHVPDKPYKCSHCPKSFIQLAQLRRHTMQHDLNYACPQCDHRFTSEVELIAHTHTVHEGKDKLECHFEHCPEAGQKFKSEKALLKHIKSHTSSEVHRCDVCGKVFLSANNARRHTATHTLERARRCMYCVSARAYVRGHALVRHVRKAHADVFSAHLQHVRSVLSPGAPLREARIRRSELDAILSVMDAEAEKVLAAGSLPGTLYAGMAEEDDEVVPMETIGDADIYEEEVEVELDGEANGAQEESIEDMKPLLSVDELADNLRRLLVSLVGADTLAALGWPRDSVDIVLERVIEQCGARPAPRARYTRVQRLRENAKHLFLHVVEDKAVADMLHTHTIDQAVMYILHRVQSDDAF